MEVISIIGLAFVSSIGGALACLALALVPFVVIGVINVIVGRNA